MDPVNEIEKLLVQIKWIEKAESLEDFSSKTLNRFGLAKYSKVFEPTLSYLYTSTSREKLIKKYFGIVIKIVSQFPDFLDNLLNTKPSPTTIGIAEYFDKNIEGKVGGFFIPELRMLFVDPIIFEFGTEDEIAEIMIHEGYHAGGFTNGEIQMDESMTQTMTLEIMKETGFSVIFNAYQSIVEELRAIREGENKYFTWEELSDLYASFDVSGESEFVGDRQDKFYDFLAMLASRDVYSDGIEYFEAATFEKRIKSVMAKFIRLFPRLAKYISPDGSFIPQSEYEVSTKRFSDIFMDKISNAVVKRIESSEILSNEIRKRLEAEISQMHIQILQSELNFDPQSTQGKIFIRESLISQIFEKFQYIPEDFPIRVVELVDSYLSEYNFQHIYN